MKTKAIKNGDNSGGKFILVGIDGGGKLMLIKTQILSNKAHFIREI